jgi:hypothetical protein
MKKSMATNVGPDNHRHSRSHGIFNLQNPLSVVRSAKFRIPHLKMESSSSQSSISNGDVELKSYNSLDIEQNFENLKEALNRTTDEQKEEIRGPTGTVRGFKNIIKDRKNHLSKAGRVTTLFEVSRRKFLSVLDY